MSDQPQQVTVDRIEGEWAVLEAPTGQTFDVPLTLLPLNVSEGDVLEWRVGLDPETGPERRRKLAEKLDEMTREDDGGDFSL